MNIVIKLRKQNNKVINLEIKKSDTIGYIKEQIKNKEGIPSEKQILTFKGKLLKENKKLDYYQIKDRSYLNLFLLDASVANAPMNINIKINEGKMLTLDVKPKYTVQNIKEKIKELEGIPIEQ